MVSKLENFPVAVSSICNTHDSVSIPSDPVFVRVYMLLATQIGTYVKFTPKHKATMLAILHTPSATLDWPCCR